MAQPTHYAGFWRRLLAHIIDSILFSVLVAMPLVYLLFGERMVAMQQMDGHGGFGPGNLLTQTIFIVLVIFFWVRFRGTPGKRLLSCEVVDAESGRNLTIGQATIRYFAYIVSALPLGLGFLWVMWDGRKQGFHDKIARTVVVVREAGWQPGEEQKPIDQLMEESR